MNSPSYYDIARLFVILGVILFLIGVLFYLVARSGITLGDLPGDMRIQRHNITCIFALGTSLLLSVILTLILNILARLFHK